MCGPSAGGKRPGPTPAARPKQGSNPAVLPDGEAVPLVTDPIRATPPAANPAVPLVDAAPPIAGKPGRPRQRPDRAMGDRGFDEEEERGKLRARGIDPELAKR